MLPHPGRIEKPAVSTSVVPVANETDQSNVSTQQSTDKAAETTNQIESQVTPIANQMILNPDQIVIGPPKETFKCAYCEYTSHNKSYLKQHVDLVHTADRPYKCPYCDYAGKRSHSLREHLIVHSNERPFQCTHCNATFRKKGHLTNHEKLHQKTVNCQLCQMSFPSSDIELHLKEHHKVKGHQKKVEISKEVEKRLEKVQDTASRLNASKVYVCSECKAMFKDFSLFVEHAKIHSTNKTIDSAKTKKVPAKEVVQDRSYLKGMKCTDCGFVSLSQEDMTKHLWTHINTKGPNRNPACPESISDSIGSEITVESSNTTTTYENESKQKSGISSSLLAVIEQLRERSKDSEILEADDTVAGRKSLKRKIKRESQERLVCIEGMENIEKVYENKTEKYRCKLCHYSNTSTSLLLQHMRLHKEKKPSECSLCEFVASSSEDLQDHMIKHCKVRTYQCKLCPSAFNYKSQLRAHMRAHNDKEVFVCDECDFESNNPTTFRNHVRGHSEKKLYKCIVCEKRFVSKADLKTHKKGECAKQKSFSCDECDFVAIGPHEQRIHAKVHAKEFNCAYCDFITTSISKFQNHTKAHEEQTSLKCAFCDFPAVSTRSLKSHMKRHINDQRFVQQPLEQYKCNLCGYVCHHLPSLKSHMWRHASDASYSYQFTNEVINAAIDYDCRLDAQGCKESDIAEFSQTIRRKLKERLERQGEESDVKAVCWVTFRCCQCGFETINKAQLSMHMKTHSDVIKWTLQVSPM
ncbi:hypothetical protein FSP39_017504 [Pinctada imbricata]|uniref:C2H2-type domain-containing protein n=1 Tax=Pinctada imbricata TaxID=66713 RepID=A0AA88XZN0_PINIB|nr:hypothetical protein FSP39_017504 [Pinctada imbricata]